MEIKDEYKRHGGAYDRGSADAYYWRPKNPHYYKGNSFSSEKVGESDMTPEEIEMYNLGYDSETERKDYF